MKPLVRVPVTFPGWAGRRLWRSCREKSRDTEQRPSSCRMVKASSGRSSNCVSASKTTYSSASAADCSDTHKRLTSVQSSFTLYSQQFLRRFWILLQYVPTARAVKFSAQPVSALLTLLSVWGLWIKLYHIELMNSALGVSCRHPNYKNDPGGTDENHSTCVVNMI